MIRLVGLLRRGVVAAALLGAVYVFLRFEVRPAPPDLGASPLSAPGEYSVVVDRRPRPLVPGDTVLVRTADGALRQARVVAVATEHVDVQPSGAAPSLEGAIEVLREDLAGRVLMTFGE